MSITGRYVASIDQGTASSRCFVFDDRARIVSIAQHEHRQHFPRPGWVEHDPEEIWRNVLLVVRVALDKADLSPSDLCALGIANQRETTVLWDRNTGAPVHNAINWQDTRTDRLCRELARQFGQEMFRDKTGLPVTTYFSGPKIRWLLDHIPGLRERAEAGRGPVRHDRFLADLEPVRPARHRRDEREPDAADEPSDARLGSRAARRDRSPGDDAPRDPGVLGGLRGGRPADRGGPGRLGARGPARRTGGPDLLQPRRRKVHVRDRKLLRGQHRRSPGERPRAGC